MITVRFMYLTGLKRRLFRNARLAGSWDDWVETPMEEITGEDGCPAFTADGRRSTTPRRATEQSLGRAGRRPRRAEHLGHQPRGSRRRAPASAIRSVTLPARRQRSARSATTSRTAAASAPRRSYAGGRAAPGLRFAVWAPNAARVEVVFGRRRPRLHRDDGDGHRPRRIR